MTRPFPKWKIQRPIRFGLQRRYLVQGAPPRAPPPGPPKRCKDVKTHGVSVLAIRNPTKLTRLEAEFLKRNADRRNPGKLSQEPPRNTRVRQSPPLTQALPSVGAPL